MILFSLITRISFKQPKSLNFDAIASSKKMPAIESSGIVDRISIVKLPLRYLIAIVFWLVTISPLSPIIDVRKTTMMSIKKRKSMIAFKVPFVGDWVHSGSRASSIGRARAFHVAMTITK